MKINVEWLLVLLNRLDSVTNYPSDEFDYGYALGVNDSKAEVEKLLWQLMPNEYNYLAIDAEGMGYIYSDKPIVDEDFDVWGMDKGCSFLLLGYCPNYLKLVNWKYTLMERSK